MAPPAAKPEDPRTKYKAFIDGLLPTLGNKDHEGRIPYFYNDSKGHLTIGIGHLIVRKGSNKAAVRTGVQAIVSYGFINKPVPPAKEHGHPHNGKKPGPLNAPTRPQPSAAPPAGSRSDQTVQQPVLRPGVKGAPQPNTAPQAPAPVPQPPTIDLLTTDAVAVLAINIHYTKPKSKKKHVYGSSHYGPFNHYVLSETGIDALGFDDVLAKIKEVKSEKNFSGFDDFPDSAKQSVIDLAFQYGAGGLNSHKAFSAAVAKQDWTTAAANVPSGIAGPTRTKWREDQLKAAAAAIPTPKPGAPAPK